jgi:YidC/Oxa1 family membrane protein insertase
MGVWTNFVDLIYTLLAGLSTMLGGNMGLAIGLLSFSVRLALLPLTLRIAHRSLKMQAALKKLEPEISNIRRKHKDDPKRIWDETSALHRQHGIKSLDGRSFLTMLLQLPLFIGLYAAVRRGLSSSGRFLWIKDLMKSDPLLACVCAILTGLSTFLVSNVPESQRTAAIILPAALTLVFLWRISAGVAVYSFSSSLVGVLQSLLLRRRLAKLHAT